MPARKTTDVRPLIGSTVSVEEVFEIADLCRLAFEWARQDSDFPPLALEQYRSLCNQFDVSEALLLHAAQSRMTDKMESDQSTRVMAALPVPGTTLLPADVVNNAIRTSKD